MSDIDERELCQGSLGRERSPQPLRAHSSTSTDPFPMSITLEYALLQISIYAACKTGFSVTLLHFKGRHGVGRRLYYLLEFYALHVDI